MSETVEQATRTELDALPDGLGSSALAAAALDLARRLDEGPADTAAVLLVRELRQVLLDLRGRAAGGGSGDVDAFLARVSATAFDAGH